MALKAQASAVFGAARLRVERKSVAVDPTESFPADPTESFPAMEANDPGQAHRG